MTPLLAPDPAVPRRDVLLDGDALAARLGAERVEHVRVKYRVGRGLGAVLRLHADGATRLVSARAFAPGRGARGYEKARAGAAPHRPLSYDPELETVFWAFPHDRRIGSLDLLAGPSPALERLVGAPCTPELAAYVPEKAGTARCLDAGGRPLAFAKVYADDTAERTAAVHAALRAGADRLRVPRVLGLDPQRRALATEALEGATLAALGPDAAPEDLGRLGAALATLHAAPPPPGLPVFDRVAPSQLGLAAELVARARPDAAAAARALAAPPSAAEAVCLHGDVNRKNAILGPDGVGLVDLDDVRLGPAAADLGSLLAGLAYQRIVGALPPTVARALAHALLGGYADVRPVPEPAALRWHTAAALLAERALRAVTRLRPAGLEHLGAVLQAGREACPKRRRPAEQSGSAPERRASAPDPRPSVPTLLLHCQHSAGLGHLTRSLALAGALARRFRVVVLSGGRIPPQVTTPAGVELVQLPPLAREPGGRLVSADGRRSVDRARRLRTEMVEEAVEAHRPAVVVVELFPFGRKAFTGELVALLEAARAQPEPALTVCSLRDILVGRGAEQPAYDERAGRLANAHLDAILLHADPRFARLEDSFRPQTPLRVPVHLTGFVTPGPAPARPARERRLVVSAGGGVVGAPLLEAALAAQPTLRREAGLDVRLIAGPFLPEPGWRNLRAAARGRGGVEVRRAVPDLAAELAGAAVSVSQCGYNTALDVLRAGVPALVVPFVAPGEDEQCRRAARLAAAGAVRALDPDALDGPGLAAAVLDVLADPPDPRAVEIDLDGAERSAELLARLAAARGEEPAAGRVEARA
jgi:predicted glycosyltransferase/Ser/Thr protein kinase RdoA (MazF antagonist)